MAQYKPGDVATFYVDPLTETTVYGTGTLIEKVNATNFEGLETWNVQFLFEEEIYSPEVRQILSPEPDEADIIDTVEAGAPPVAQPTTPVSYKTLTDKPNTVEEAGLTNAMFIGKSRPITNSPVTPGTFGEWVFYDSHNYFCIGNNLWIEFTTIAVP